MTAIMGQRCKRALSSEGPISDDGHIRKIAGLQRDMTQLAQGVLLMFGAGYASWLYNDPYREDGEDFPKAFFAVAGSAALVFGAITAFRIQRWCRNPDLPQSWVAHPFIAVFGGAMGYTSAVLIAGVCAEIISNAALTQFEKDGNLRAQMLLAKERLEDTCYSKVFERRFNFTVPACTICVNQDDPLKPQFYQAIFVENFTKLICEGSLRLWQGTGNITELSSTDPWPCRETIFNDTLANSNWRLYVSEKMNIWPPMSVQFYPYNESCFLAEGSGTWVDGQLGEDLCENLEDYDWNPEAICTTPAWNDFVSNFSAEYNAPLPNVTLEPNSLQVSALIDDNGFYRQFYGGLGFMSSMLTLMLLFPSLKKSCKRIRPAT